MKKRNNRFLAGTLAGLMMLTMLPVTALAAQEGADGDAASDTSNSIVNVVSDGKNVQQAENNNVNVEGNGGTDNAQKSADDSSGDTENAQKSADDSNDDTENAQESADDRSGDTENVQKSADDSSGELAPTPTPAVGAFVAKIVTETGTETYGTLDAAIEAAKSGAEIEIGNDEGVITVNEIRKNIVINGNGHTVTIPDQEKTDHRSLNIYASLTFNNTKVKFVNNLDNTNVWSATVNANSVLTLDQGSICTMENHGIYAENGAIINVKGQSKLTVKNTTYTALMADDGFANLNIEDGSEITITDAFHGSSPQANGINNFKIRVINSYLTVTHCENQGLVRCELTLDKSNAEISGNDMGITGYADTNVLTMKNGATLLIKDNAHSGIFMHGGNVDVQDDNYRHR